MRSSSSSAGVPTERPTHTGRWGPAQRRRPTTWQQTCGGLSGQSKGAYGLLFTCDSDTCWVAPTCHYWLLCRLRQREFFTFGMDVLLQLDLAETRQFFTAFFSLSDFHWQVCGLCRKAPAQHALLQMAM